MYVLRVLGRDGPRNVPVAELTWNRAANAKGAQDRHHVLSVQLAAETPNREGFLHWNVHVAGSVRPKTVAQKQGRFEFRQSQYTEYHPSSPILAVMLEAIRREPDRYKGCLQVVEEAQPKPKAAPRVPRMPADPGLPNPYAERVDERRHRRQRVEEDLVAGHARLRVDGIEFDGPVDHVESVLRRARPLADALEPAEDAINMQLLVGTILCKRLARRIPVAELAGELSRLMGKRVDPAALSEYLRRNADDIARVVDAPGRRLVFDFDSNGSKGIRALLWEVTADATGG